MIRKISRGYWKIPGKAVLKVSKNNNCFEIESVNFQKRTISQGKIPFSDYASWDYAVTRITKKEYFLSKLSLKER